VVDVDCTDDVDGDGFTYRGQQTLRSDNAERSPLHRVSGRECDDPDRRQSCRRSLGSPRVPPCIATRVPSDGLNALSLNAEPLEQAVAVRMSDAAPDPSQPAASWASSCFVAREGRNG
jgi:hypothetical protein